MSSQQQSQPESSNSSLVHESTEGPVTAAYRCGRALTRWYFFATQEWLGAGAAAAGRETAAAELERHVRRLVTPDNRDDVQQRVRDILQRWQQALAAEWHVEELTKLRQLIGTRQGPPIDPSLLRHEIWKALGAVDETEAQLRRLVHALTDPIGVATLSLGAWLERRVCPREVGILSCSYVSPLDSAASQASSWSASPQAEPADSPAFRFLAAGDAVLPPPEGWLAVCEALWQEFLSSCSHENEEPSPFADANSGQSPAEFLNTAHNRILTMIHQFERGRTGETGEQGQPGYLGLILNNDQFIVRRAGLANHVDLSTNRILWEILIILERRREQWTDRRFLAEAWENLTLTGPVPKTIGNRVNELSDELLTLGITIKNKRRSGWRLRDVNDTDDADVS